LGNNALTYEYLSWQLHQMGRRRRTQLEKPYTQQLIKLAPISVLISFCISEFMVKSFGTCVCIINYP
jgi:hypothetical protein